MGWGGKRGLRVEENLWLRPQNAFPVCVWNPASVSRGSHPTLCSPGPFRTMWPHQLSTGCGEDPEQWKRREGPSERTKVPPGSFVCFHLFLCPCPRIKGSLDSSSRRVKGQWKPSGDSCILMKNGPGDAVQGPPWGGGKSPQAGAACQLHSHRKAGSYTFWSASCLWRCYRDSQAV